MRHLIPSYIRVPLVFFIIAGLVEYFVDSGDKPAFMEQPIILLFLLIRRLGLGISPFSSPLFPTSIMIVVMGFQSILMGLIAELLVRTYHEAQDKPTYTIREKINEEK